MSGSDSLAQGLGESQRSFPSWLHPTTAHPSSLQNLQDDPVPDCSCSALARPVLLLLWLLGEGSGCILRDRISLEMGLCLHHWQ